jgi:hypothetical protein
MLTAVDVGVLAQLKIIFNNVRAVGGNDLTIKLYTNNVAIDDTKVAGDFTIATGGGYVDKTLTMGSWTCANVGGIAQALYAIQTWTFTGPLTGNPNIYGYIVVDADDVLAWAEALAAPFTPANNGDKLNVTPKYQGSKGTPT